MKAIIYARFSTLEQAHGSSLARQHDICRTFADQHDWEISEVVEDQGTSAYTGENIRSGNLAALTTRLEREGGLDTVIVVEQLDRLTRRPAVEVLAWIGRVTASGASIATVNDRLIIDATRLANDQMTVVGTVFNSFRAFMESQHKSERLSASWSIKRASDKPLTSRCVAWLRLEAGKFVVREDRAEIVRTIYQMASQGIGAMTICRTLNEQGLAPWGRGTGWQPSYIKKILQSRAVIGEYQPHRKPRGQARTAIGEARTGYYPQIIDNDLWQTVQARSRHNGHSASRCFNNLLSGLAYCEACEGKITRVSKGPRWEYFRCERSRRGLCDNVVNYRLRPVVAGILDQLMIRMLDPSQFRDGDRSHELTIQAAAARRLVDDLTIRRNRVRLLFEDGDDGAIERMRELSADLKGARAELHQLTVELDRENYMPADVHLRAVSEVRALMDSPDDEKRREARQRVKIALDAVIGRITFKRAGDVWGALKGRAGGVWVEPDERGVYYSGIVDFVPESENDAMRDMRERRERVVEPDIWIPADA